MLWAACSRTRAKSGSGLHEFDNSVLWACCWDDKAKLLAIISCLPDAIHGSPSGCNFNGVTVVRPKPNLETVTVKYTDRLLDSDVSRINRQFASFETSLGFFGTFALHCRVTSYIACPRYLSLAARDWYALWHMNQRRLIFCLTVPYWKLTTWIGMDDNSDKIQQGWYCSSGIFLLHRWLSLAMHSVDIKKENN
jgi:hypothetical protein